MDAICFHESCKGRLYLLSVALTFPLMSIGLLLGMFAGYFAGWLDSAVGIEIDSIG